MEKIILLGNDKSNILANRIGAEPIIVPELHTNNQGEVCDFVTVNLKNGFSKLVIDADNMPSIALSLLIAMYIRLSPMELGESTLAPIFFLSSRNIKTFMRVKDLSQILLTPHVHFEPLEREELIEIIQDATPIQKDRFQKDFLDYINIQPGATVGRHSLANQWGASVLSKIILGKEKYSYSELIEASKNLYFRYISCKTTSNKILPTSSNEIILLEAIGKKILLIDDEAQKGWKYVLENYFSQAKAFDTIDETVSCFDDFSLDSKKKITEGNYDLIFLDLRLNGAVEDKTYDPEAFSGMKVLKKIKSLNKGTQVIMLTASNKAWNLKALLDAGADGYYIKESPEYEFSRDFSLSNFNSLKETITKCLKKTKLRTFYNELNELKGNIVKYNYFGKDTDEVIMNLNIAFDLIDKSYSIAEYSSYAYLQLFLVIEKYVKQENVFEKTDCDLFLDADGGNRYWILKKNYATDKEYNSTLKFSSGHYKLERTKYSRTIDTNFLVSSLLIYKFGQETSGAMGWTNIYKIRNGKAAHPQDSRVKEDELKSIIDFMLYCFNDENKNWRNKDDSFAEESKEDKLKKLKEKFSSR